METQGKTLKDLRLKKRRILLRKSTERTEIFWRNDATSSSVSLCLILCQGQRPSSFSNA
jgi:hypothetical protein